MGLTAGTVDPAFAPVAEAFEANFDDGEIGAGCCVIVNGRVVVDLWGGWADGARTRPWQHHTLVNCYSVGKPVIATRLLQLVGRGRVSLDTRADEVWPELRAGQAGATLRQALCHQAGIPAIRTPLTNDDLWQWPTITAALAATEPWWPPGTRHAYHTNTYGHLIGELARRLDGLMPGEWLARQAALLGADMAWGLGPAQRERCAEVVWQPNSPQAQPQPQPASEREAATPPPEAIQDEAEMIRLGYTNPSGYSSMGVVNSTEWRAAQVPSTNIHATAAGIARFYAALAGGGSLDGVTLIEPLLLAEATRPQSVGWCPVLQREVTFGLGFQLTRPDRPLGPNPRSFGHFGTGGSLGFADPDAEVAFGYAMNAVKPRWQNSRNRALVDALYRCL